MISGGRSLLGTTPHISLIPATVLFLTVLALNAVGEKLSAATASGGRSTR